MYEFRKNDQKWQNIQTVNLNLNARIFKAYPNTF